MCFKSRTAKCIAMIVLLISCRVSSADDRFEDKIQLKILYAGNPGSDRAVDFEKLLAEHFEVVTVADYSKFEPSQADGADVMILDWTSMYPRDDTGKISWDDDSAFSSPPAPRLPATYDRPTVLIGGAGGSVSGQLDIAINWK